MRPSGHNVPNQFLTFVMEIKTRLTKYDGATTSATQPRINDNIGKNRYFRFDDVIKLSYRYIFSITKTWMGQMNTPPPPPHILKLRKLIIEKTDSILETPSTEYTQEAFIHSFHRMCSTPLSNSALW